MTDDEVKDLRRIADLLELGDPINDLDLARAIKRYDELHNLLCAMPRRFQWARTDVLMTLNKLHGFKDARARK
jgi:hypothetical protein